MSRYDIAIIGMGCVFPAAHNPGQYWENIASGQSYFKKMPDHLWRMKNFTAPDPARTDKSYTMTGAFIDDFEFPFDSFDDPDGLLQGAEPTQLAALEATRQALADAGVAPRTPELRDAVTIFGCSGVDEYVHISIQLHRHRYFQKVRRELSKRGISHPTIERLDAAFERELTSRGHAWDPQTAPVNGMVSQLSGRVARTLGIGGFNMNVDAACASSFVALDVACQALMAGDATIAIAGGADLAINPTVWVGFSRVGGLSQKGQSNPFDQTADGLVLGEGAGAVVLKRLEEALDDGNKIHGVIRGIGSSSDGAGQAIYAPAIEGRVTALKRALNRAEVAPEDVQFIEAHATSTVVGDANEYDCISRVYGQGQRNAPIYLGSVKGQIGHMKAAAGVGGLIKTLLGMNNKTVPHMPNFQKLTEFAEHPSENLAVPTQLQEWPTNANGMRVAAITASGFGGVNYHTIVEQGERYNRPPQRPVIPREIAVVGAQVRTASADSVEGFWDNLTQGENLFERVKPEEMGWQHHIHSNGHQARIRTRTVTKLDKYDYNLLRYKIFPNSASQIAPTQFLGLNLADQLLSDANLDRNESKPIGISVGAIHDDHLPSILDPMIIDEMADALSSCSPRGDISSELLRVCCQQASDEIRQADPPVSEHTLPGYMCNVIAGRMANKLNLSGPNFTVDTDFSSGIAALIPASYQLMFGDVDSMITGGLNQSLSDVSTCMLSASGSLAAHEARPFDATSDGFLLGEGGVLYLLKTLANAKRDGDTVLGILNSVGGATEHTSDTLLSPSKESVRKAIENAFQKCAIRPEQLGVIEAHGKANTISDLTEAESIATEVRPAANGHPVRITAASSHLGHLLGASGAVSMLSVIETLATRTAPGIRNLERLDPDLESFADKLSFLMDTEQLPPDINAGGVVSLGMGGANYFAIFSRLIPENAELPKVSRLKKPIINPAQIFSMGFLSYIAQREPSIARVMKEAHSRYLARQNDR